MTRSAVEGGRRAKVVLYNPKAVFHTFPLSLVAVGSALDRERYEVVVVDGRLDPQRLLAEVGDAAVLGMSVLTGAPIRDALEQARAVRALRPDLPIVWGGWHASLFPLETLDEPLIDVTVRGQGEATFVELLEALLSGADLSEVRGIGYRKDDQPTLTPARAIVAMDDLPEHDYSLIPVERYFAAKGQRQLDYISSTGCPFRCSFCADPKVFGRKYTAVSPERLGQEIQGLHERYRFDELAFQDETFFTYRQRSVAIAEQFLERGLQFAWTATLRADQATRLDEQEFALCVRSGFRRAMIGVESGSQEMMDWMRKDIRTEQVLAAAELCRRYGVAAIFPFIVGFPGETDDSVTASLEMVKQLRAMSPQFETPIFYYKPYPGTELTDNVVREGFELPSSLVDWSEFDFIGSSGPWVSDDKYRRIERFKFYNRFAGGPRTLLRRPLQALSRLRCRHDFYGWPIEKAVVDRLLPQEQLS